MISIKEAAEKTGIDKKDINGLIITGRISRPKREDGQWIFSDENIKEIIEVPKDLIPSYQRALKKAAIFVSSADVSASLIALVREYLNNETVRNGTEEEIINSYAAEFIKYFKSISLRDLSKSEKFLMEILNKRCNMFIELNVALNLFEEKELVTTRQLALLCNVDVSFIRKLWRERRICPHTQNTAGHLMWKVDDVDIENIKLQASGENVLSVMKFQARRDIVKFSVAEEE